MNRRNLILNRRLRQKRYATVDDRGMFHRIDVIQFDTTRIATFIERSFLSMAIRIGKLAAKATKPISDKSDA